MSWLELRVPPPVVAGLVALLMWFVADRLPVADFTLPVKGILAGTFATVGIAIGLIAFFQFRKAATTVHPMKPQESSALVAGGVYRFTRNPMYLGMLLILTAWGLWLANAAALLALPLFVAYISRFQIAPEERALEARFGASFADYRRAVRRWL
ncbi:MAG TPA: isoprenylcysteine carboxylmethyltransferase family protein [Burkholderiales bacterium]